jgi:hypothetical protein
MVDPAAPASIAAATTGAYAPRSYVETEYGDVTSYRPIAKTVWSKNGDGGEENLSFNDLLDVINPLQHLPIISTLYRAITGEKIGLAARLAGDALYGGGIGGLLTSGVTAVFEGGAGKSTGEMVADVANAIFGPSTPAEPPASLARAPDVGEPTPLFNFSTEPKSAAAPESPTPPDASVLPQPAAALSDDASQRIARSVAEAQRAQAGLLIASIQQPEPAPRSAHTEAAKPATNPFLPPTQSTSPNNWGSESLAETIARYERAVAANRR